MHWFSVSNEAQVEHAQSFTGDHHLVGRTFGDDGGGAEHAIAKQGEHRRVQFVRRHGIFMLSVGSDKQRPTQSLADLAQDPGSFGHGRRPAFISAAPRPEISQLA